MKKSNTGKQKVVFKTSVQRLIEVIEQNGWDWKANGGQKILDYLVKENQ